MDPLGALRPPASAELQNQTTPVPLSGREMFQRALAAPVVDLDELRDLVRAYGLPDETKLRPVVWQVKRAQGPGQRDWLCHGEHASVLVQVWIFRQV